MIRTFYTYDSVHEILNVNKFEEVSVDEYSNVAHTIEDLNFDRVDIQTAWIEHWWSFLSLLWHALSHADMDNAKLILENFGHYAYDYYMQWRLQQMSDNDIVERKLSFKF